MSFHAMSWAMRQKTGDMATKAVLMALANYADDEGSCFPSVKKLADDCECSTRTVIRALVRLGSGDEEKGITGLGILSRNRRSNIRGGRTTDRYFLHLSDNLSPDTLSNPKCQIVTPSKDKPITKPTSIKNSAPANLERIALMNVLDADHADAVIEHRKKLGKPLTHYAAKVLAGKLNAWPKPNEAADEMIVNGWLGFSVDWMDNGAKHKPTKKPIGTAKDKLSVARKDAGEKREPNPVSDKVSINSRTERALFQACIEVRGQSVPVGQSGCWSFPLVVVDKARLMLKEAAHGEMAL